MINHLVLEAVNAIHLGGLVVPPPQEEVVGVQQLVREEDEEDLDGPGPAVHKVPVEEILERQRVGSESAALRDPPGIVVGGEFTT